MRCVTISVRAAGSIVSMRSKTRTGRPFRANMEAAKSPAADPPTTATCWLFVRGDEARAVFVSYLSDTIFVRGNCTHRQFRLANSAQKRPAILTLGAGLPWHMQAGPSKYSGGKYIPQRAFPQKRTASGNQVAEEDFCNFAWRS